LTKIRKIKSDCNYLEIGQIFMFANGILSSRIVSKYDCKRHCGYGNKKERPLRFRKYPHEWAVATSWSISLSLSPHFCFFFSYFFVENKKFHYTRFWVHAQVFVWIYKLDTRTNRKLVNRLYK